MDEGPRAEMEITLQYFDGCPTWAVARDRLYQALELAGLTAVRPHFLRVEAPGEAERVGFQGSPTILINGRDALAQQPGPGGLSCRLYDGPGGSPSVEELVDALRRA
ncbi:MAG: hypothetical protein NVS3B24_01160 [Candidatus Dormibacteria bacterium]